MEHLLSGGEGHEWDTLEINDFGINIVSVSISILMVISHLFVTNILKELLNPKEKREGAQELPSYRHFNQKTLNPKVLRSDGLCHL